MGVETDRARSAGDLGLRGCAADVGRGAGKSGGDDGTACNPNALPRPCAPNLAQPCSPRRAAQTCCPDVLCDERRCVGGTARAARSGRGNLLGRRQTWL